MAPFHKIWAAGSLSAGKLVDAPRSAGRIMTVQARSDTGGNTGPAKTGDADQGDVNLVDELPSKIETEEVTATVTSGGLVETVVPEPAPLVRTGAAFADDTHQEKCMDSVFKHSERLETPEQSTEL
jgi:hypothetical protein